MRNRYKIGLFIPCYVDLFYPQVGIAAFELLTKLGLDVHYPPDQICCGQPLANAGAEKEGMPAYNHFVRVFNKFDFVVSPSGSCVYHVREQYKILTQSDETVKIRRNTFELCEFLVDVLKKYDLKISYPHKVAILQSCHGLRGLRLGGASEITGSRKSKILQLLEGAKGMKIIRLDREDECCGFGGLFSVSHSSLSVRMGKDRLTDALHNEAEVITATDMSCLMHLEGIVRRKKMNVRVVHIAEILNHNSL